MGADFLLKEYEECLNQLRFYDERNLSLFKYSITMSASIATAIFAVIKFIGDISKIDMKYFWLVLTILSLIVFIGNFLILLSICRNRLYFFYAAKQVNSIRKYYLDKDYKDFNNQMYLSTDSSAFKLWSIHSITQYSISFIASIYFSIFSYSLICNIKNYLFNTNILIISLFLGLFIFILLNFFIIMILINSKNKSADEMS